jgi:hypothetical protein
MHVDSSNVLLWGGILISLLILVLLIWVIRLEIRLRNLLIGAGSKNLDQTMAGVKKALDEFNTFRQEEEKYLTTVEKRLKRSLQAVETVRFNPFKGSNAGGNQSFATAFINEKGDGVVFSSLYAHDRMSIFSKPLAAFSSTYELTGEEKSVLEKSKETLKN